MENWQNKNYQQDCCQNKSQWKQKNLKKVPGERKTGTGFSRGGKKFMELRVVGFMSKMKAIQ